MLERSRFVVSDAAWEKVAPLLPGKVSDPGATARDNRLFLEAVLWRVRTGAQWRDLPGDFGHWNSVFQRFRRWVKGGVFERVFGCLSDEPDFEYALIDGTIVTAHQKASGARGGTENQAIGRSRGGLTTKIVALADALDQRRHADGVVPLARQQHEARQVAEGIDEGEDLGRQAAARAADGLIAGPPLRHSPCGGR